MAIRIAIDINDVVRDYSRQFSECYKKYTGNWNDTPDVTSFDYMECFDFADNDEYVNFRYVDYAFDLSAKAEAMDKMLPYKLNDWLQNTLRDVDEDKIPEVMFVSALESGLTIQATYFFLSKIQTRVREVYFPIDSSTIWDRCDLLITANPKFINSVPD
ncbi:MAG: hypothetical protein J6Y37_09320, partial [Paludibacteraceae bacterium]|nr:hypothetical protein [Paludibacteraceae bacterium]